MASKPVLIAFLLFIYNTNGVVQVPKLKLNDGREIPALALGTWLGNNTAASAGPNSMEHAVKWALDVGYRHIDTAWIYQTEEQVGRAIRASGVPREEVFVTTKLWNDKHARENVIPALRDSLKNLKMDYVDLYLIHWPCGQFVSTIRAKRARDFLYLTLIPDLRNLQMDYGDLCLNHCTWI